MERVSQSELADMFVRGETHGRASNVQIREVAGGYTLLVGYGHAVYAARSPKGHIVAYRGWYGHSPSTSCHLTKMGLSHPNDTSAPADAYECIADHHVDKAPKATDWEPNLINQ